MASWDNQKIFADKTLLTRYATERIVRLAQATLEHNETFSIALSGGSTPKVIYALLAEEYSQMLNWERIHLFWGDERCVAPTAANSNYRMVKESLLDHIQIPEGNVHRMKGEDTPQQAAADYAVEVKQFFPNPDDLFDLTLLGMGSDGHTASLFPGTDAVHEKQELVVGHYIEAVDMHRLTLTPPAILRSMNIMFIISGAEKAEALHEVLLGSENPDLYPSQVISRSGHAHVVWALDEAAASKLP